MTPRRATAHVLRTIDAENRIVRFVFSDGSVDRMNDVIDPNGWDVTAYKRNPVVLWSHDSSAPPIGRTVNGPWSDGSRLLGDIQFADKETHSFADTIYRLVKGGYLNAGSVGFLPLDYSYRDDAAGGGLLFKKSELLEFSITPVPANSNALAEARSKGLISGTDLHRLRGADTDAGSKERRQRIADLRRQALQRYTPREPDPPETRAQMQFKIDALRERYGLRRVDPRIAAAEAAFRLRGW